MSKRKSDELGASSSSDEPPEKKALVCPNCAFHLSQDSKTKEWIATEPYPRQRAAALVETGSKRGDVWTFFLRYEIDDDKQKRQWSAAWEALSDVIDAHNDQWELRRWDIRHERAQGAIDSATRGFVLDSAQWGQTVELSDLEAFLKCDACHANMGDGDDPWYNGNYTLVCPHDAESSESNEGDASEEEEDEPLRRLDVLRATTI